MGEGIEKLADDLTRLLNGQLSLYQEMLALCGEQQREIEAGNAEGLIGILARKQNLISRIERLSAAAQPLRLQVEPVSTTLPAAVRASLDAAVEGLKAVLGEIVAIEDAGQAALGNRKDGAGEKLVHLQKGKLLHKAYGAPKPTPIPRFKDKNG